MDKVFADFVRYNANSRSKRVGDCVKRGLSVAYSMDYDEVSKELNRIKNAIGANAYNSDRVFELFMRDRGDKFLKLSPSDYPTVEGFAADHPTGVYIVLSGKNASDRYTTHMIAIVNGDIYDSWDSREHFVKEYAPVTQGKSDVYELDAARVANEVTLNVYDYVTYKLADKQPDCMRVHCDQSYKKSDKYTYKIYVYCDMGNVPGTCRYWPNRTYGHFIIMKLNPRLSEEENIETLTKKCKQKAYDWIAVIRDNIVTAQKAEALNTHPDFKGQAEVVVKLPEWAQPLVTWAYDTGTNDGWRPRYEVVMEALPDDPRRDEGYARVDFEADTLRELKQQIEIYKDSYDRVNYDY